MDRIFALHRGNIVSFWAPNMSTGEIPKQQKQALYKREYCQETKSKEQRNNRTLGSKLPVSKFPASFGPISYTRLVGSVKWELN